MVAKKSGKKCEKDLNCYRHTGVAAITTCIECGRKICAHCTTSNNFPHICPSCYSKEYDKIQKKQLVEKRRWIKRGIIATILVVVILVGFPLLNWALDEAFKEDKEDDPLAEAYSYLDDADVYLQIEDDPYNPVTNKVTLSIKFYLTNEYETNTEDLYLELLILKNTTIRDEDAMTVSMIPSEKTQTYWFNEIEIYPGTYYADFIMWKDDMVYRKVVLKFTADRDDIRNVQRLGESALNNENPYKHIDDPEEINKPQIIKDTIVENMFFAFLWICLILLILFIVVGLYLLYRESGFEVANVYAVQTPANTRSPPTQSYTSSFLPNFDLAKPTQTTGAPIPATVIEEDEEEDDDNEDITEDEGGDDDEK